MIIINLNMTHGKFDTPLGNQSRELFMVITPKHRVFRLRNESSA
jgi:hypothetical protein